MEIKAISTSHLTRSRLEVTIIRVLSPLLFWVQLKNSEKDLEELQEDLDFHMSRKAKYLHYWPQDIKEDEDVVIKENNRWRRGWIEKFNKATNMVKICLGDFGRTTWRPVHDIYYLDDRFRKLPWQAIACGLAHTGSVGHLNIWPDKTKDLCRILAENRKGWINIVYPLRRGAALVKLTVQSENFEGTYNLREMLLQLGHVQLTTRISMDVFPAV